MATSAGAMLPSIKCSNCGNNVEISMMGDHVCSSTSQPILKVSSPPRSSSRQPPSARNQRMPPSRLDTNAANRPFLGPGQASRGSSRSASPISPAPGRTPRMRMPPRSMTTPLTANPPSPELSNLDCAFPPFPISRTATPTRTKAPKFNPPPNNFARMHAEPSPNLNQAPLSPSLNGGNAVSQRMNKMAPGPFDLRHAGSRDHPSHRDQFKPSGTQPDGASGTTRGPSRPASPEVKRSQTPNPSNPVLARQRRPSLPSNLVPKPLGQSNAPQLPGSVTPQLLLHKIPEPSQAEIVTPDSDDMSDLDEHQPANSPHPDDHINIQSRSKTFPLNDNIAPLKSPNRSQTMPLKLGEETNQEKYQPFPQDDRIPIGPGPGGSFPTGPLPAGPPPMRPRRPSEAASITSGPSRARRPTLVIEGTIPEVPLQPGQAIPMHPPRNASRNGYRQDPRLGDAPPVPLQRGPNHMTMLSTSSSGSSAYDGRTISSRSSPPVSMISQGSQPSSVKDSESPIDDPQTQTSLARSATSPMGPPGGRMPLNRSNTAPPGELQQPRMPFFASPESPIDPAIQHGRLSPLPPANNRVPMAPPPNRPGTAPPGRRKTLGNRGNCKGCGVLITGKSISSADGRLTGRYHKQCFVCKTCKSPFQTSDFYVLENQPYCERHYHELNGSLCGGCDHGIEGPYIQTHSNKKYHPNCFKCEDCHTSLQNDYFEVNNKVYCSAHAGKQSAMLGPGRKFPERRTTRLMMM
ncbi:MAG: hypothetical protein M1834_005565 [Cirrosporium novae-zelandiae]|nr:MAG: hypothetical protein M1834_005565 [Cirrosporium novae-zelandiae]